MAETTPQKRYTPLMVTLHWLTAVLIFATLGLGIVMEELPGPEKVAWLRLHMPLGIATLLLLVARLVARWRSPLPAPANSDNPLLDKIAGVTHGLLYLLALLVPLTGMLLNIANNLSPVVFFGQGQYPAGLEPMLHGLLPKLMAGLLTLHIGAALWHQLFKKDALLSRMWFGK